MKVVYGALVAVASLAGGIATGAVSDGEQPVTDFKAAMMRMDKAMMIDYTGNPDVDFVRGMIPHHQGAIDMAKVELQYGQDPALRKMADDIVAAQEREIGEMKQWQAAH